MKCLCTCGMVLVACLGILIGMGFSDHYASKQKSSFELAEKYASTVEKKLIHLLEPVVGIGNIRTSVQAEISYQNSQKTQFDFANSSKTVTQERGPVLVMQSVSVLINGVDKSKLSAYQNLIKSAVGFNMKRGDTLSMEVLPFVKIPLWTLGLDPIYLMRLIAILTIFIFIGLFWLIKEWLSIHKEDVYFPGLLDKQIHQFSEKIPLFQMVGLLKTKRPEITAFILHCLPEKKVKKIITQFDPSYMHQVLLHMEHINQLNIREKSFLLKSIGKDIQNIVNVVPEENASPFRQLINWTDQDIQKLLHYISKKDLVVALKTASLMEKQIFARNIPPALWQELIKQEQEDTSSKEKSYQTQEKIMRLAELLKEKNNALY